MGEGEGLADWAATSEEEDAGSQAGLGATAVSFGGLGEERQLQHKSEAEDGVLMQVWSGVGGHLTQRCNTGRLLGSFSALFD